MAKKEDSESGKKQFLLRVSPELWNEINAWAQDDFRSINGQIEYILTMAVRKRKKAQENPTIMGE